MHSAFNTQMSNAPLAGLHQRLVRYADLVPCTTAFIDARTPGSDAKENFTIIGPGVAENPDQHVHISEPHGFNIGGARQPPGCLNSQHFHETAEVFFVHSGRWAFRTGEHADEGEVILEPGDTISIPVHVFRGFENVGTETGFLYAVLGGDDPGRVIWAPDVLEKARGHGLLLLESGRLVDTLKDPTGAEHDAVVTPEPRAALERIVRHIDSDALEAVVVRGDDSLAAVPTAVPGLIEGAVLGGASAPEAAPASPLAWAHGFVCRRVRIQPDTRTPRFRRDQAEVIFVHAGRLDLEVEGQTARLGPGDTVTIPVGAARVLASEEGADLFVTRAGDAPAPAAVLDEVVA
jgi:mannose-6-phosphate isomerase-like protein (cupin superfamily)